MCTLFIRILFLKEKIMQLSGLNKGKVYAEVSLSMYFPRKRIKGESRAPGSNAQSCLALSHPWDICH